MKRSFRKKQKTKKRRKKKTHQGAARSFFGLNKELGLIYFAFTLNTQVKKNNALKRLKIRLHRFEIKIYKIYILPKALTLTKV